MEFVASQAHYLSGRALKSGSYGTKRSSFRHMIRLHNGTGFPSLFADELAVAWRGFTPTLAKGTNDDRQQTRNAGNNTDDGLDDDDDSALSIDDDDDDDRDDFKEGKEPMSPELYRHLCEWALRLGTGEGVFLAAFLVWTWNLCCRGHNTARIRFSHISWAGSDSLGVFFRHTKSDETGDSKHQKRHLYSNPFEPCIDICFVTALYLSCCFQNNQTRGRSKLFPGDAQAQSKRASDLMHKLLKDHEGEVLAMGYDSINDIGLHSARKCVCSFLASLPGGPSAAAICLRAGWTMGIYGTSTSVGWLPAMNLLVAVHLC
jgi:hypothetical protein